MKESTKIAGTKNTEESKDDLGAYVGILLIKLFIAGSAIAYLYTTEIEGIPFENRWLTLITVPIVISTTIRGWMHIIAKATQILTHFVKIRACVGVIVAYAIASAIIFGYAISLTGKICAMSEAALDCLTLFTVGAVGLYVLYHFDSVMSLFEAFFDNFDWQNNQ